MSKDKNTTSEKVNKSNSWLGYTTNLLMSATGGYIFGGVNGAGIAATTTLTDEYLIQHNYTKQHYLSKTVLNCALVIPGVKMLTDIFPEYWLPIYGLGGCVIAGSTYYSKDPLNSHDKIDDIVDSISPLVELLDEDKIISQKELTRIGNEFKTSPINATKIVFNDLYYS
jgi:hypothetical protein